MNSTTTTTITGVQVDFVDAKGQEGLFAPTYAIHLDADTAPEDIKSRMVTEDGAIFRQAAFGSSSKPLGVVRFKLPDSHLSRYAPLPSLIVQRDELGRRDKSLKEGSVKFETSFKKKCIHIPMSAKQIVLIVHHKDSFGVARTSVESHDLPAEVFTHTRTGQWWATRNLELKNSNFWDSISFDRLNCKYNYKGETMDVQNDPDTIRFLSANSKPLDDTMKLDESLVEMRPGCIMPGLGHGYHHPKGDLTNIEHVRKILAESV